jgi:hypothetical protein
VSPLKVKDSFCLFLLPPLLFIKEDIRSLHKIKYASYLLLLSLFHREGFGDLLSKIDTI